MAVNGLGMKGSINGFIKSDEVFDILEVGRRSIQHVVLYGPGGYGKSEMSVAYLKQAGIPDSDVTVKVLSVGTYLDDLLGGVNMKRLQKDGVIEYNLEHSIFNTKWLILEEAFDAPVRILESLKDILTSKTVRNGAQIWPIKTEHIIICTNRNKSSMISDASSAALMERFPLSLKVYWDTHDLTDYIQLARCVGKYSMAFKYTITHLIDVLKENGEQPVPPRTAVRMMEIINNVGIDGLKYLDIPYIDVAIKYARVKLTQIQDAVKLLENRTTQLLTYRSKLNDKSAMKLFNRLLAKCFEDLPHEVWEVPEVEWNSVDAWKKYLVTKFDEAPVVEEDSEDEDSEDVEALTPNVSIEINIPDGEIVEPEDKPSTNSDL